MFDFDASKLLIVGVIALIFIPSKDLPRVLRQVGQFVSKARRMASEFQSQFMDAMKEADMADLRKEAQKLAETARIDVGLDSLTDLKTHVTKAIDGTPKTDMMSSDAAPIVPVETSALPAASLPAASSPAAPSLAPSSLASETHETMDGAGMKDPNAELRRLTGTATPELQGRSDHSETPADPVAHSAL